MSIEDKIEHQKSNKVIDISSYRPSLTKLIMRHGIRALPLIGKRVVNGYFGLCDRISGKKIGEFSYGEDKKPIYWLGEHKRFVRAYCLEPTSNYVNAIELVTIPRGKEGEEEGAVIGAIECPNIELQELENAIKSYALEGFDKEVGYHRGDHENHITYSIIYKDRPTKERVEQMLGVLNRVAEFMQTNYEASPTIVQFPSEN